VALIALAFTEKFTNPVMAVHTIEEFPALDVFGLVGIHLTPETFALVRWLPRLSPARGGTAAAATPAP
jgi:hypothetical protein